VKAVQNYELRHQLKLVTWQELAEVVPPNLRKFLQTKYGIETGQAR
jgi:hypothetical protein